MEEGLFMKRLSVDELRQIPAPEATKTWRPVSHETVHEQVNRVFQDLGLVVTKTTADVGRNGASAFVTYGVDIPGRSHSGVELGWRNSTDKSIALGFTAGVSVYVCSNMVFRGDWIRFRKHTSGLTEDEVYSLASYGVNMALESYQDLDDWHEKMSLIEMSRKAADSFFMRLLRKGAVSSSKMLQLVNAWDEECPRYGETLYTAYQCATQTFRDQTLPAISRKSQALHSVVAEWREGEPG